MVDQKGLDLILGAVTSGALQALDASFVILGTGAPRYEKMWRGLAARLERANLLVALGDDAKAKEDVTAVLRMEPRSAGGIDLQAVIAARAREFPAAVAALTQIQNILGRFPRGYYFQAVVKFNMGQAEQANEAATRFLSRNPRDPDGLKLMARIQMAGQRPQEAIDLLAKAEEEGVKADGEGSLAKPSRRASWKVGSASATVNR
jgi:tetratricopeptide (TPR) repeat protein